MYTNEREAVYEEVAIAAEKTDIGNSRLGLGVILTMSAFVGLWGVGCLISGLSTLESLGDVIPTMLKAILGV